ncbi:hypothetical protein [Pseudomonas syringae group genomosp. 3]|uniref:hypothetical protein n=2 Tax=Pseudomonas TaxID=286 RepID=UPI0025544DFA|nr:hypothetical protein [Pseudomonas syringae group genomosp. 3]WIN10137.1 hypothetical protein QQF68_27855 [Pseudomonas syringae pv. antirrhini str. 126]
MTLALRRQPLPGKLQKDTIMLNAKSLVHRIATDAFSFGYSIIATDVNTGPKRFTSLEEVQAELFSDEDELKPLIVEFRNHSRLATQWELEAADIADRMNLARDVVTAIAHCMRCGRVTITQRKTESEQFRVLWIGGTDTDQVVDLGN